MYTHELQIENRLKSLDCVALDIEQLNQNTFGDFALRSEILRLFLSQLEISRHALLEEVSEAGWRFVTHTLKGAAAAVGALQFVSLAMRWEAVSCPVSSAEKAEVAELFDTAKARFIANARSAEGLVF